MNETPRTDKKPSLRGVYQCLLEPCPKCGAELTLFLHHEPSFAVPECDYRLCEVCGHHLQGTDRMNKPSPSEPTPEQEDWRMTALKEVFEALDDLTFSCFAGIGLQPPAIDVYNHAFAVCEKYREQGMKPNISWRYRKELRS